MICLMLDQHELMVDVLRAAGGHPVEPYLPEGYNGMRADNVSSKSNRRGPRAAMASAFLIGVAFQFRTGPKNHFRKSTIVSMVNQ
mgnify:CR=1 FL=1